jgi:selenide, water dikinase
VGAETGDDAAVYRLSDEVALVATTDFITPVCDDPFLFGEVAAANALSDVFAMGGRPLLGLAVCAFPEQLPAEVAAEICAGGAAKARAAGAVVAGGHSVRNAELLYGLAVTGQIHPGQIVRNVGVRPGDLLVLTKPVGTGVIIAGHRAGKVTTSALTRVCRVMAELNQTASRLMVAHGAHAATDVTGFGLAGHALGMARGSGVRLALWLDRLPIHEGALELLAEGSQTRGSRTNRQALQAEIAPAGGQWTTRDLIVFDPQTSGGLLVALEPRAAERFAGALAAEGVTGAQIVGEALAETAFPGPRLQLSG